MKFLSTIPDNIMQALTNTFIYSLWQGLILAVLAGLVILLTKRAAAGRRYNLLVGLLAVFAVTIVITFVSQYKIIPAETPTTACGDLPPVAGGNLTGTAAAEIVSAQPECVSSTLSYINAHAEMIVLAWFLIVCARCVQLLTGLHGLRRLRYDSVSPGKEWEARLKLLADRLGIRQQVQMAESAIAKVPMVIGHFKPIILIPAALLTAMSTEEIEAVLIHELAHIRRRDYLVNMLQHLMEIVFFFNPAVLWVSSLIKTERENCCDDITLHQTNDKTAYIRALISCQEFQLQTPRMAVGLSGRKNLLGRVSRMVSSSNHSLSIIEKSFLTVCLVAAGIMLAAFSGEKEKQQQQQDNVVLKGKAAKADKYVTPIIPDQNPDALSVFRIYQPVEVGEGTSVYFGNVGDKIGYKSYILKKQNTLYQLNYIKNKLVSLQVDGKNIPSAELDFFSKKVEKLNREQDYQTDSLPADPQRDSLGHDLFDSAERTLSNGLDRTRSVIDEMGMALGKSIRQIKAVQDTLQPLQHKTKKTTTTTTTITSTTVEKEYDAGKTYNDKEYNDKEYKTALPNTPVYKSGIQKDYQPAQEKEWIRVSELITNLVSEGIVEKEGDVESLMINPQQMILNGKKIPADLHRLILDKYIKADTRKKWTIYYNFDTSTIKSIGRNGINAI